jgi:hypothetical protein
MRHTDGPWWACPPDEDSENWEIEDGYGHTATVYGDDEPAAANARLMAAAPDMLAALKMWMELETTCDGRRICYCDDPEVSQHGKCYACVADAAISKAEGRD